MRWMILILVGLAVAYTGVAGCIQISEPQHRESQNRRVKVDAPFTHVDVAIPDYD